MTRIAICPHLSVEHFRGGEKWVVELANRLVDDGYDVSVNALPYAPDGERRVDATAVLDDRIPYEERWRHDLSGVDTGYLFYHPGAMGSFPGAERYVAGIHSWIYVSPYLHERHYGLVPTAVKLLYRLAGEYDLARYDVVHTVTPAFETRHSNVVAIPNFVDAERFSPDRAPLADDFTVLFSAAHIPEKGWDIARRVAANLPTEIAVLTTGQTETSHIEGMGFLSEVELARLYARSHVVLHPARVDTDSMVINEACASGTPVVTSPIISHVRKNGAVIHAGTASEMTAVIRGLRDEFRTHRARYEERCRLARDLSDSRRIERVYPELQRLLVARSMDSGGPNRRLPFELAGERS